ncbi:MAG TPA: zinc ribbon domain-containing protein [Steroidobacteraceae bacterium]|jgi:hypothetical protein|nr:zinc ribbon domain-containing protein [Steroidobacteraceae bacterium]
MKSFCTRCGAALNPDTTFCTGCGAAAAAAATTATTATTARKNRKWPWVLALIIFFALGFWLGHRMAPKCPACPALPAGGTGGGGGGGGGGGHPGAGGGGGKGDPDKGGGGGADGTGRVLGAGGKVDGSGGGGAPGSGSGTGDMAGGGHSSADGTTIGHGNDSSAVGSTGSDDGGGGTSGSSKPGDSPNGPNIDPDAQKTELGVARLAAGAPLADSSGDGFAAQGSSASVKVLSAHDFTYDKTGLPRYPDANKAVFSALSYDMPGRTDTYGSGSGIVTGSSFDDVVAWYRKNLPPGWSSSTIGDLNRLGAVAQALSPDKIMQMLSAPSDAAPAKSAGDIPATAAADRTQLSMFSPPAGTKGDLGVMIVQRGDKPVTIMMKSHISP